MSEQLRLERQLPALLEDLYLGGTPDYRDEVFATVARTRQRPAWTFPERWLPMVDIATRPAFVPRLPTRLLIVLALLVALAVALVAYVGTRKPLPAPFGPARNGLVVYALGGDLYTGDPATGRSALLVGGPSIDRGPQLSPDGARIVFRRGAPGSSADAFSLVVVNVDGSGLRVLDQPITEGEPLTWAPGSDYLLRTDELGRILRYDLGGGTPRIIAEDAVLQVDAFRPPTGDVVLYEELGGDRSLLLMKPDGTASTKIYVIPEDEATDGCDFGTVRWSPDGSRIAFLRRPAGDTDGCRIFVMNADGSHATRLTTTPGTWTETDLRWSPDGKWIAFDRWQYLGATLGWQIQPLGLVPAAGGEVRPIGTTPVPDGAAFEFSPDGTSIIAVPGTVLGWPPSDTMPEAHPVIIDVATGEPRDAAWLTNSWPAWQRLADER